MRVLLPLLLLLTACARPGIEIDTSELTTSGAASASVGLLEVKRANTGSNLGIPVTESLGESAYCTGTILNSELVTSADCLRGANGGYNPKDMRFYFHPAGDKKTHSYKVAAVRSVDVNRNLAFLTIKDFPELPVTVSIPSTWPPDGEVDPAESAIPAFAITVPAPNKKGVSRIKVAPVTVEIPVAPPPPEDSEDEDDSDDKNAEDNKASSPAPATPAPAVPAPAAPAPVTTPKDAPKTAAPTASDRARPHGIFIRGLKDGTWGAPLFFRGHMVGLVKNSRSGRENGHWIVGR